VAAQGSQERVVYATALDAAGMPVEGLGPDAFAVRENGVRREILRVSPATDPIDLTILIDNSTAAREDVTFYRRALPGFIDALVPPHRVALVGLAQRPTVLTPSTTDAKRLKERAEGLFALPDSGATFLDAVVEVSQGLMKRDAPRAAIVAIVTDATEFTNRYAKDVIAAARRAHAAVHIVSIGQFSANIEHADRERNFVISQAPAAPGGSHGSMLAASGLAPQLERLARELKSQYSVVYARPDALIPPDTIEVASAREGLTVRGTPARPGKGE
jgi:VWFA-related protein